MEQVHAVDQLYFVCHGVLVGILLNKLSISDVAFIPNFFLCDSIVISFLHAIHSGFAIAHLQICLFFQFFFSK